MTIKKALAILLLLVALLLIGFWVYVQMHTYPAEADALDSIFADDRLEINENQHHYIITPSSPDPAAIPIIYYPGGLVAPEAYLYKMGLIALDLKTSIYIIKAPFNAAIFNTSAAGTIIDKYDIKQAWVGGHSLGGIAACRFVSANPDHVFGLFLFGSYCNQNLSSFKGHVLSIKGLQDSVINHYNYSIAKSQLPERAVILEVEGLNHSGFGNYGLQQGDGDSNLSDEQIVEIISAVFIK